VQYLPGCVRAVKVSISDRPSWFTEKQPEGAEVWVLNATGLLSFIEHEHAHLSQDDISHISGILEAHILLKKRSRYDELNPSWKLDPERGPIGY